MVTVCFTYFRSLTLANLDAALYSVRQQDLSRVSTIEIIDNNTDDAPQDIWAVIDALKFPVPTHLTSHKHCDASKTHAWSTNVAVSAVKTPWIIFTRADYLLDADAVRLFLDAASDDNRFIVGGYCDVMFNVQRCEDLDWRKRGVEVLRPRREFDHVLIDAGVWCASRKLFDSVGGLDERLSAWGHAQTHFQHKLFEAGAEFVRLPKVLFYHVHHSYDRERDLGLASEQLAAIGAPSAKTMWARYEGVANPYKDMDA
jgi:hypothetical protein